MPKLDDLDRRIAAVLQIDGRSTWRQAARLLAGTSESTVARRAQSMLDAGIMRVNGLADPIRCGFGHPVLLQLSCEVGTAAEDARRTINSFVAEKTHNMIPEVIGADALNSLTRLVLINTVFFKGIH